MRLLRQDAAGLSGAFLMIGEPVVRALRTMVVASVAALSCAGCGTVPPPPAEATAVETSAVVPAPVLEDKYVITNEPGILGRQHFERGHYGLSARYFSEAVEKKPRNLDAWIGLGASYDQLKRFDLADRAYKQALQLGGPSVPLLNNMGYSYMLRGDLRRAKATFERALKLDPTNVVVLNNIRLLEGAVKQVPVPR